MVNNIRHSVEEGKYILGLYIALTKAFDTVDHIIPIDNLYHYGIRGLHLNWFKSYISDRKQYIFVNEQNSSITTVKSGGPQGSVLGPLSLLYINDLMCTNEKLKECLQMVIHLYPILTLWSLNKILKQIYLT